MKRHSLSRCVSSVIGTGVILCASVVHAQSIPVLNHAYEFDTIPHDTQKTTAISGWVNSGVVDVGVEIPLGGGVVYNGFDNLSQAAYLKDRARVSQRVDVNLALGKTYTLNYLVGWPLGEKNHRIQARIKVDGLVVAELETNAASHTQGSWKKETLSFTPVKTLPIGRPLTIEFVNPPNDTPDMAHIDDVSLVVSNYNGEDETRSLNDVVILNHTYNHDLIPIDAHTRENITAWHSTGNGKAGVELTQGSGLDYQNNIGFEQVAYLEKGARISQALDVKLEKGETYTLNYNLGRPLGTSDHSVMARIRSEGLVLAQQHTRAEHIESGEQLARTLSFTATETMPLGSTIAIEFYNPPTTAGAKVHIDNVQMRIAGTGEEYNPEEEQEIYQDEVSENVVNTHLTINVPEDFDDLYQAIDYLDNKIIQNDKLVTIQVNQCNQTYNEPIVMSHPQGSQISIRSAGTGCILYLREQGGFVVTTALRSLDYFQLWGPNNDLDITGLRVQDGATVGQSNNVYYRHLGNGVESTEGSYVRVHTRSAQYNNGNGVASTWGGLMELDTFQAYDSSNGILASHAGLVNSLHYLYLYSPLKVEHNSYVYIPSNVYIRYTILNMHSTLMSHIDFTGDFLRRSNGAYHHFHSSHSSWINYENSPTYHRSYPVNNSYVNHR